EYHVRHDGALVAGCGDVEKDHFVGALLIVAVSELDRIAGVAQVDEVDALHNATAGDIETGDDSLGQHPSEFQKIAHALQTYWPGFFRMELHSENVAVFQHRRIRHGVGAACG